MTLSSMVVIAKFSDQVYSSSIRELFSLAEDIAMTTTEVVPCPLVI